MWDVIAALPEWFVAGLLLGGVFAGVVTLAFVAGQRLFAPIDERAAAASGERETSGAERRRAEIRHYLDAIGEPYVEDERLQGQRVAFYLPERDVAVTFDARAFFRLQATDTEAVLIEHELPGGNLGSRLPFETPELTVEDDTENAVAAAFAALGLPASADGEAVRRAYRRRVKEVHPDHGGDEEAFRQLQDAYDTAREHAD